MSDSDLQQIIRSKEAERRRLRELPWLEKLEMLDRLRDRHLLLRQTRAVGTKKVVDDRPPEKGKGQDKISDSSEYITGKV